MGVVAAADKADAVAKAVASAAAAAVVEGEKSRWPVLCMCRASGEGTEGGEGGERVNGARRACGGASVELAGA